MTSPAHDDAPTAVHDDDAPTAVHDDASATDAATAADAAADGALALVLGSSSPGRAEILRRALIPFTTRVSHVDEDAVAAGRPDASPADLAALLAEAKGRTVAASVARDGVTAPTVVVGCDSVFELDGVAHGKPHEPEVALERWRAQSGRTGVLHTGQWAGLIRPGDVEGPVPAVCETISSRVTFAAVDEATVRAYVATGEPLACAGAFTIDGAGAALVDRVEGDPDAVIGLSVAALRRQCGELGVRFASLWESSNRRG